MTTGNWIGFAFGMVAALVVGLLIDVGFFLQLLINIAIIYPCILAGGELFDNQ